ncbi:MAG: cobalt transporter [Lachnospiraceae bacterium]|nr:cobalt transporter [Lachnospiraceae bacterium]MCR4801989.1 cobalt transporter [Lachnospiraceae bacterium]
MKIFELGKTLEEVKTVGHRKNIIIVADTNEAEHALEHLGIKRTEVHAVDEVAFCKVEVHHEYVEGNLFVPKLGDIRGDKMKIQFYFNHDSILFVDDCGLSFKIVKRISKNRNDQGTTRERFLYEYFSEMLSRDVKVLREKEVSIRQLEDRVLEKQADDFQKEMLDFRKELLVLRSYYEELEDLMEDLKENENDFLSSDNLNYFDITSSRAERLMNRTEHLINYLAVVRETYMEMVSEDQNSKMNYLTVLSTIFLPLSLITGWFGMNFENMNELKYGYPGIIGICAILVLAIVWFFKRKHIL